MGVRGQAPSGAARNVVTAVPSPTGLFTGSRWAGRARRIATPETPVRRLRACRRAPLRCSSAASRSAVTRSADSPRRERDLPAGGAQRLARERAVAQIERRDRQVGAVAQELDGVPGGHIALAEDETAEHTGLRIERSGVGRRRPPSGLESRAFNTSVTTREATTSETTTRAAPTASALEREREGSGAGGSAGGFRRQRREGRDRLEIGIRVLGHQRQSRAPTGRFHALAPAPLTTSPAVPDSPE